MQGPSSVRPWLSYANVMATFAFFFALTGASLAGVKYITATDVIPSSSDPGGSTYGNPVIAAGKVTTTKIADGAITSVKFDTAATAPNAAKLNGHTATEFAQVIARGTFTIPSGQTVEPGGCTGWGFDVPAGANPTTDFVLVKNPEFENVLGKDVSAQLVSLETVDGQISSGIALEICDNAGVTLPISGSYPYMILR
jgi:hypothetical protein